MKWSCRGPNNEGIQITKEENIIKKPITNPQNITVDISGVDLFCQASLIEDCNEIILIDSSFQTIAIAKLSNNEINKSNSAQVYCGKLDGCDAKRVPTSVISGNLNKVAVVDQNDHNIRYEVGGTVAVENDCTLKVNGFYVSPVPKEMKWSCRGPNNNGIQITKAENIIKQPITDPQNITVDISGVDLFCQASLLEDCNEIILMDSDFQTIALAKLSSNEIGASNSSSGSSNTDVISLNGRCGSNYGKCPSGQCCG